MSQIVTEQGAIRNKVEPLRVLTEKYGVDVSRIKIITTGTRYTAVMLDNGNIGVCANLGHQVTPLKKVLQNPDLTDLCHRILLNAYFGATLNYPEDSNPKGDIFDVIDVRSYSNVAMIGLFRPIIEKFNDSNIPLKVFDISKSDPALTPLNQQLSILREADAVILSSTTVFNMTFLKVVQKVGKNCDIFMLGPSSIMSGEFFDYGNIRIIFGSVFKQYDENVLRVIHSGSGTRDFQPLGMKVYQSKTTLQNKAL